MSGGWQADVLSKDGGTHRRRDRRDSVELEHLSDLTVDEELSDVHVIKAQNGLRMTHRRDLTELLSRRKRALGPAMTGQAVPDSEVHPAA
jgi:hypothetical protein